ncbi:MAG: acyl-CoA thioesterase [Sphingopyxis sp.]|nr:acyl-CoA thioesterase [Sphingopyxis sp.]
MFTTSTQIRFAHVDAAAIVFYPRYFEMLNAAVEDWFAAMEHDFRKLHVEKGIGTPTVKLETEFLSPSELGEMLVIEIDPQHVGRSSCTFTYLFTGGGRDRLRGQATIVCMDLVAQRSVPWPDPLRERIVALGAEARV